MSTVPNFFKNTVKYHCFTCGDNFFFNTEEKKMSQPTQCPFCQSTKIKQTT